MQLKFKTPYVPYPINLSQWNSGSQDITMQVGFGVLAAKIYPDIHGL